MCSSPVVSKRDVLTLTRVSTRGLENWEQDEEYEVPKVSWRPWTEAMMQVAEQYAVRLPLASDAQSGDTTREEYQAWLGEAFKEVHSGVAMILSPHFELIAQKV